MVANLETDGDELDEQAADFRTRIDMAKELLGMMHSKLESPKRSRESLAALL
ncbi:hypothetical protein M5C90_15290 [Pseudomonas chlororaphis subsp. piscium]|nr:hypothetical protein M5C90_15290 [Pseudomonas chlororaphis subsp. piscium]